MFNEDVLIKRSQTTEEVNLNSKSAHRLEFEVEHSTLRNTYKAADLDGLDENKDDIEVSHDQSGLQGKGEEYQLVRD